MLISLKIFGGQIVNLISLKSQTNSLLEQLRAMKEQQGGPRPNYTAPQPPPPQPKAEQEPQPKAEPVDVVSAEEINEDEEMMQYDNQYSQLPMVQEDNDLGIIETSIETKE
jgi:hypothetical protein